MGLQPQSRTPSEEERGRRFANVSRTGDVPEMDIIIIPQRKDMMGSKSESYYTDTGTLSADVRNSDIYLSSPLWNKTFIHHIYKIYTVPPNSAPQGTITHDLSAVYRCRNTDALIRHFELALPVYQESLHMTYLKSQPSCGLHTA